MHSKKQWGSPGLLFAAVSAPIAIYGGGRSLLWAVAALAAVSILYIYGRNALPAGTGLADFMPPWLLWPEILFLVLAAAKAASAAALCWQGDGVFPLFPMALLALAAASVCQGRPAVLRCTGVLSWGVLLFYAVILIATAAGTEPSFQANPPEDGAVLLSSLLLMGCSLFLTTGKDRTGKEPWLIAAFTMLALYCAAGKGGSVPLLTAVKSTELLGVLQRFEALASCAMTAGIFALLALFGCAGGEILRALEVKAGRESGIFLAAAAALFVEPWLPSWVFVGGSVLFWGLIPLLTLLVVVGTGRQKRIENPGKKC